VRLGGGSSEGALFQQEVSVFPDVSMRACAWLSLACWAAAEWLRRARGERDLWPRLVFSAGLGAMLLHSYLAFAVRYAFSFEAALADAARQIEAVTGRPSSPRGFYTNYAFLAWWAAEAAAWWRAPARYAARSPWLVWLSRVFFVFMFVNGAIVFAAGPVRVLGAAGVAAAVAAWVRGPGRPLPQPSLG
jgi:hypothetical protein